MAYNRIESMMLKKPKLSRVTIFVLSVVLAVNASASGSLAECDLALYEDIRENTVKPLFEALRNGEIPAIRKHLSDRTKHEYDALFNQNENYGQFLREFRARRRLQSFHRRRSRLVAFARHQGCRRVRR